MTISLPDTIVIYLSVGLLVGLAIGSRGIVGNWLAGIFLRRKHLRCGDLIEYGKGFAWVQKAGPLNLILVTCDKRRCVVPNRSLLELQGQGKRWTYSRQEIDIRIPVADNEPEDISNMVPISEVARILSGLMKEAPELSIVSKAGAQAIQVTAQAWIRDPDDGLAKVKSGILQEVWDRVHTAGLTIPISIASRPRLH